MIDVYHLPQSVAQYIEFHPPYTYPQPTQETASNSSVFFFFFPVFSYVSESPLMEISGCH